MNGSLLLAFAPKGGGRDIRLSVSPREGGGGKKVETQVSPTKYACFALSGNLIPLLKADTERELGICLFSNFVLSDEFPTLSAEQHANNIRQ